MGRLALLLLVALAASACLGGSSTHSASHSGLSTNDSSPPGYVSQCPLTRPSGRPYQTAGSGSLNYGNQSLHTNLWPHGTLRAGKLADGGSYATVNAGGSIYAKLGWWRSRPGTLTVTGQRLDGPAQPLRADVPAGYGEAGFQPSGITFPSTGCWKVEGHLGGTTLAFVVRVVIRATTTAKPSATFRVVLPKPHSRWKDLFAVEIIPTQRLPVPVKMWLYNAAHHVVAHHWLGACSTCPTPAGGTLTVNVRYHVEHVQAGMVTILDPASGYRVSVPVILTNLPAPTE